MRGDIILQQTKAMDQDISTSQVLESHPKSPRTARRSRIDRLQRGNIDSLKEFQRSFDEIDIDEVDNAVDPQHSDNGYTQNENSLPRSQNKKDQISINVIETTPTSKSGPSFEEEVEKTKLSVQEPADHPNFDDGTAFTGYGLQMNGKPPRRVTVHGTLTPEPEHSFVIKRRANTAPRVPSELSRLSTDENSSSNSTPSTSPSLRRRGTLDITSTPLYRELYANNLRSYGFLLYKDLIKGQSSSDSEEKYQSQIKKRRRRKQNPLLSSSRQLRRHTDTPIFIEQRASYSADEAAGSSDDDKHLKSRPMGISRRSTDLGVYNLNEAPKVHKVVDKRKTEADKRQEYRSARMRSLDEIIDKVNNMLHQEKKIHSNSTADLSKGASEENSTTENTEK